MRVLRISISVLMLLLWGCSSHEDLEPPNNPFDPGNPDYVSPAAEIVSGPAEGEVVDTTGVTFTWQGNQTATEYSYQFDGSEWSVWTVNTSAVFDYLDEGDHAFAVKSRSLNGDIQVTPTALDFSVDAVAGPSVLVFPYKQTGSPGDTLVYQIIAEEVTDLFAVECHIEINDNYLELIDFVNGDILNVWGGESLIIQDITPFSVSLSMVSVEGDGSPFSGSSSIASMVLILSPSALISTTVVAIEVTEITYLNSSLIALDGVIVRNGELEDL